MERPAEPGLSFKQYFQIVPALTDALKDQVYAIRHRVYCEELAYEPPRPDRREIDEYDADSLHVLIRSVASGDFIGCTRIIRARRDAPERPLPFEKVCASALDRAVVDPALLPRTTIAEVSRLAVVSAFRRRKGEHATPVPLSDHDFGTPQQPRFPYIPIGLYIATVELARLHGIRTLFVLTEQRLASHFGKLGVRVDVIGTPVEHRGIRIPSMMSTDGIIHDMKPMFRPLYEAIAGDVARGVCPDSAKEGGAPFRIPEA